MYAFANDEFLLQQEAAISIGDLSINRGYGIFDYLKTIDNFPVFLQNHLDRFYFSAGQMHLPVLYSREELGALINELVQRNNIGISGIRLTLTGGVVADGYSIGEPNLILTQHSLHLPATEAFDKGIKLLSYEHQRQLPHVKTIDYLMPIWLQPLLKQGGADDLLYHANGVISECPRANIFIVTKEGGLATPGEGILKGITRMHLLQLSAAHYAVAERAVGLEEVADASEVFITSTTKGVLPVTAIDGKPIGNGTRDVSRHLNIMLNEATQRSIAG